MFVFLGSACTNLDLKMQLTCCRKSFSVVRLRHKPKKDLGTHKFGTPSWDLKTCSFPSIQGKLASHQILVGFTELILSPHHLSSIGKSLFQRTILLSSHHTYLLYWKKYAQFSSLRKKYNQFWYSLKDLLPPLHSYGDDKCILSELFMYIAYSLIFHQMSQK